MTNQGSYQGATRGQTAESAQMDFLQARVAEERDATWCGLYAHDPNSGGEFECWDPRADCDTRQKREWRFKQDLLELHTLTREGDCDECREFGFWPCRTLDRLASVWSDHPDYDPEWQ